LLSSVITIVLPELLSSYGRKAERKRLSAKVEGGKENLSRNLKDTRIASGNPQFNSISVLVEVLQRTQD
jgi:hypothetical protein